MTVHNFRIPDYAAILSFAQFNFIRPHVVNGACRELNGTTFGHLLTR
jgi:hypothetical protein